MAGKKTILSYRGEQRSLVEWAAVKGMSPVTLSRRLQMGWDVEKALETQPNRRMARMARSGRYDRMMSLMATAGF